VNPVKMRPRPRDDEALFVFPITYAIKIELPGRTQ
jgi:hypothetical protein